MPTKCNRGFYCRSYCLLNMFRAPLCPSSGAQEYYTVVAACGISCCGFQVAGLVWSWGLCVRFAGCCSILQSCTTTLPLFSYLAYTQQNYKKQEQYVKWYFPKHDNVPTKRNINNASKLHLQTSLNKYIQENDKKEWTTATCLFKENLRLPVSTPGN